MGYITRRMESGERIVYEGRVSWVPLVVRGMGTLLATSAVAGVAWGVTGAFAAVPLAYAAGFLVWAISCVPFALYAAGAEMVITTTHIHSKTGIVRIDNDREATLDRIDRVDVDMHRIVQRVFDYGDIEFQTVGTASGFFTFRSVSHPYEMRDAYNAARLAYNRSMAAGGAPAGDAAAGGGAGDGVRRPGGGWADAGGGWASGNSGGWPGGGMGVGGMGGGR